jgi:hypothetical protein
MRFLIFFSTFILFLIGEKRLSLDALLLLLLSKLAWHWHKLPHTSDLLDTPIGRDFTEWS